MHYKYKTNKWTQKEKGKKKHYCNASFRNTGENLIEVISRYPEKRDCYRNIESIRINWPQCLNYKVTKPHASINLRFAVCTVLAADRF